MGHSITLPSLLFIPPVIRETGSKPPPTRLARCFSSHPTARQGWNKLPCSERPGETRCLLVWGLEPCVRCCAFPWMLIALRGSIIFLCGSVSPVCSCLDSGFIYLVSPLGLNVGPKYTNESHPSIFTDGNWGKLHVFYHFFLAVPLFCC